MSLLGDVLNMMAEILSNSTRFSSRFIRIVIEDIIGGKITNTDISANLDAVSSKLNESKALIDNALSEIAKQKEEFKKQKEEAAISQQISNLNKKDVDAMTHILENQLQKRDKKKAPKELVMDTFFCVLSAVIGFVLAKLF